MSDIQRLGIQARDLIPVVRTTRLLRNALLPQRLAIQLFTNLVTEALTDLLVGRSKQDTEEIGFLTQDTLGELDRAGSFNLGSDAYFVLIEITAKSQNVQTRLSQVAGQPDLYRGLGGVTFDWADDLDEIPDYSLVTEMPIERLNTLFIVPRQPKPAKRVIVYLEPSVVANVYQYLG